MNFILNFFWDVVKDIANLLLWVFWECLVMSINNDSITLQQMLMSNVLKSTCKKPWCLSVCNKSTSSLIFVTVVFWDVAKTLQTFYFENIGNALSSPSKSWYQFVVSFLAYLLAKNQLHHPLPSYDIAKK